MLFRRKAFQKKLRRETPKWVEAGIIDAEQQEKILAHYTPRSIDLTQRLPAIVIGLATLLVGLGILLFYAANWRTMPPPFKLFQVFSLIVATYGASYYCFVIRPAWAKLGRVFLLLGMVSFGAGIALVAQIYHISAHPSKGVLAWSLGGLATAWVMKERWGYYLGALLLYIWNFWEYFEYFNPNYVFVLGPLLLLFLFYRGQEKIGVLVSVLGLIFWVQQIHLSWATELRNFWDPFEVFVMLFTPSFHQIPLGVALVGLGRWGESNKTLALSCRVMTALGWLYVFLPLIGLSWPLPRFTTFSPSFMWHPLTVEYLALLGIAASLMAWLHRHQIETRLLWACTGYGLALFFLPLGHLTTLMVLTHLGLLFFYFGLLYSSYSYFPTRRIERFLAFAFPITMLVAKGIGFFGFGISKRWFYVAHCVGFIIFGTVCFLINQTLHYCLSKQGKTYPVALLNSVCAVMGFFILYALSFRLPAQTSVFDTTPVVLTLLGLFLALAMFLYGFLWQTRTHRLELTLSGIIFFSSVGVLLISGPHLSWVAYSLIFNGLLFLLTATLLYYSPRTQSTKMLNLTILGFLLHIGTRYFDLFWDLLSGSLLFIVTGVLALGGGYLLEKKRKKLLKTMQAPSTGALG